MPESLPGSLFTWPSDGLDPADEVFLIYRNHRPSQELKSAF